MWLQNFLNFFVTNFFVWPFFLFVHLIFPLWILYPEHLQLSFDSVVIACSLESIRPGLVQGCKVRSMVWVRPAWQPLQSQAYPTEHGLPVLELATAPLGQVELHSISSLQIGVVLSPRTDMWGAVTNTGYISMPTSLGIVRTLIHCLGQGSMADKPRTIVHPSVLACQ